MKLLIFAFLLLSLSTKAQTARKTANGNYIEFKKAGKSTGKTITIANGKTYPVYETEKGKLYYVRVSKTGKEYKRYIKID